MLYQSHWTANTQFTRRSCMQPYTYIRTYILIYVRTCYVNTRIQMLCSIKTKYSRNCLGWLCYGRYWPHAFTFGSHRLSGACACLCARIGRSRSWVPTYTYIYICIQTLAWHSFSNRTFSGHSAFHRFVGSLPSITYMCAYVWIPLPDTIFQPPLLTSTWLTVCIVQIENPIGQHSVYMHA